jgi:osomolarity two-component system response regulator SKN7
MLEDPSYASIVRWGDEGDSFVVLEVNAPIPPPCCRPSGRGRDRYETNMELDNLVREIYQDHPAKTLQA